MKAPLTRAYKPGGRLIRALIIAAVLTLSFASCDFLFSGMFPADVAQITARIDLSNEIPELNASAFRLSILRLPGTEYVLLFSSDASDPTRTQIFVLSPTLQVLNRYSLNGLMAAVGPGLFIGNTAITWLAANTIVIGNLVAAQGTTGLDITGKLPGFAQLWNGAIMHPTLGSNLWTNFRDGPMDTLAFDTYDATWAGPLSVSHPTGIGVGLVGVFTNPEDFLNNAALIVFKDRVVDAHYFVQVPINPDLANLGSPTNLLLNPLYPSFMKSNLSSDTIALTSSGIVAYDGKSQSWTRFLPSAPDVVSSMNVGRQNGDQRSAFSYSGGYFCTFDTGTRVMTRYQDWW